MKKFITIFVLLLCISFSKSAFADFYGTITNSTGCTITVTIYDGSSNVLYSGSIGTGTTYFSTCTTGTPATVNLTYSTCTRTLNLSTTPDVEPDVQEYCGFIFSCGNVQTYNAQMTSGSPICTDFVSIGIN
ncbi:MAG: hypothetical protein IT243_11605 [Bacteroidia bacterium]|nr:hypothetical protein [Bacteroidia bacterium]